MSRKLIINTAILICSAFIFRLLFIHIGIISSSDNHTKGIIKAHFSTILKRKKNAEASNYSANHREYALVEVFEEDSDENKFKPKANLLGPILYSLVADEIKSNFNKKEASYKSFSYTSTHRYLSLQVFRI
jgi:hypothetical protein